MKVSILYKFLNGDFDVFQFKSQISQDVKSYAQKLQKKGASVTISIEDDLNFVFKKQHLLKLCDHYLNDELDSSEIEYIVDCIIFRESDVYEEENLIDFLESMTDSSINGILTKVKVSQIKKAALLLIDPKRLSN